MRSALLYHYRCYGLQLASQLELPELVTTRPAPSPDARILLAELPPARDGEHTDTPWIQADETHCQLQFPDVMRLRIEQGRQILVERRVGRGAPPGASAADIRLYLLGGALGALLHQRHWLPLHLSALETPSGVWGFTGPSGAGKSTLAAWLHHRQGWPLVSDDVAVIRPEETTPLLYPGPPRLKLWKDTLASLGIASHGLVQDLSRTDKYHLLRHQGFQPAARPLKALVVLESAASGEAASLERLRGVAAFQAVMATIYRPELGALERAPGRLMQQASELANRIRVYRFRRPRSLAAMTTHWRPLIAAIKAGDEPDA
ncbi:hypothetical protein [Halomonas sp. NO4]|uniref:hypothetical protein n=1 Tax=Halomonas sp. NO4 TaxID=2484813 RepID=UPI0013D89ECC|nr:hypothetical protein [Halomonas sp. NO4]